MAHTCRYDPIDEVIRVGEEGQLWVGEDGGLVGSLTAVADGSLASLRRAVVRADRYLGLGAEVSLTLYDIPEEQLLVDEEAFNPPQFQLTVLPDRCLITCTELAEIGVRFDRFEITAILVPVLARQRLTAVDFSAYEERSFTVLDLTMEVLGRGRTLGVAAAAAQDVLALWEATFGGALSAAAALDLLRAGRPYLLVGQPESDWLEAKREPYRLDEPEQQLELAKDVASLANAPAGGVLVVGLATIKRDGTDVIAAVRAIPAEMLSAERYRRVIRRFVYPPPEGLTVEFFETGQAKGILVVSVPDQPAENRPLLVLGAIVGDKVSGSHVSIVRRYGDATTAVHPAALHSLLAAGRAALAGEWRHNAAGSVGDT